MREKPKTVVNKLISSLKLSYKQISQDKEQEKEVLE
jgi:hypothetical protein